MGDRPFNFSKSLRRHTIYRPGPHRGLSGASFACLLAHDRAVQCRSWQRRPLTPKVGKGTINVLGCLWLGWRSHINKCIRLQRQAEEKHYTVLRTLCDPKSNFLGRTRQSLRRVLSPLRDWKERYRGHSWCEQPLNLQLAAIMKSLIFQPKTKLPNIFVTLY